MIDLFTMPIMGTTEAFRFQRTPERARRALANHGQTLEQLRDRGGLTWREMEALMQNVSWRMLNTHDAETSRAVCVGLAAKPD